jgi:succinyl-CoA synthetase beta subunit
MHLLLEDETKAWLRSRAFPAPRGAAAASAEAAGRLAETMTAGVVVKALVPGGRRGKEGGVRLVADAAECGDAAAALLGGVIAGHRVERVYVEERVAVARELYLSFILSGERPEVLVSRSGGIAIEDVHARDPGAVVRRPVDPRCGISPWQAMELWLDCGVDGALSRRLAGLTAELFAAFQAADALILEINPLAISSGGDVAFAGAMMAIDPDALYRHPEWDRGPAGETVLGRPLNEREARVRTASRSYPGGDAHYQELDGDIGLLVGGGGAGLYLHDLIVDLGGRPANHCVTPPTASDTRKLKEVLRAIFDNPALRGLLVGFNFAQMARADIRVRALVDILEEKTVDTSRLPIVIRLFGPGEEEARRLAAGVPGILYLPRGTSLRQAAERIVALTNGTAR